MTLVVGRITQGSIRVDSDSKITDPNEVSNKNSIFSGLLKSIILNPTISVSYAGEVDTAQKAVEEIYKLRSHNINEVKSLLLEINKKSNNNTDFLIASIENQPLLYKIANGKIEVSNTSSWIGDIKGFNVFQKEYFPNLKNMEPKHIWSVHSDAFEKVIESNQVESVDGFHITVHMTEFGLEYKFKMNLTAGRIEKLILKPGKNLFPWGDAGTGAFSSCYLKSKNPFKPAIGIHFPIGNFGTLYYPRLSRQIIKYNNVNGVEFIDKVKSDYNINLTGMIKEGEFMKYV